MRDLMILKLILKLITHHNKLANSNYRAVTNATKSHASGLSSSDRKSHDFGSSNFQPIVRPH